MQKLLTLLLLASACWGQVTVNAARPRVHFDTEHIAWMAAKKTGTAQDQAQWTAFANYVAQFCGPSQPVNAGKQGCAYYVAIAYKADPVTFASYRDKACQWIKYRVDRTDGDTGGALDTDLNVLDGNVWRNAGPAIALEWDTLHDHCEALDPTIGQMFREFATIAWNYYKPGASNQLEIITTPYRLNANIGMGRLNGMVQVALAAYEPTTFEDPATWLSTMKTAVMDAYVIPAHSTSAEALTQQYQTNYGGVNPEGMGEYGPEAIYLTMDNYESWRVGTNVDVSAPMQLFARQSLDWLMHATAPQFVQGTYNPLYRFTGYRDVPTINGAYHGMFEVYHRLMIGRLWWYFYRTGDTERRDYAQFWSKEIDPGAYLQNPPATYNNGVYERDVMYQDATSAGVDYRTQSLAKHYLTPTMLLGRTDWTTTGTHFMIMSMMEGIDHQHQDSGTFAIARKGKWLTKEIPGYYNLRSNVPGSLHNILTLNGHSSFTGRQGSYVNNSSNNNGTNGFRRRAGGGYMANCNDTYCSGELETGATYKYTGYAITHDVEDVRRNFLWFKNFDLWVISDRIDYAAGVSGRSIFHVQAEKGAPSISGGVATISNADQRLHVTPVAPSTFGMLSVRLNTLKVVDIHLRTSDVAAFYFDGGGLPTTATSVTLTGFTGDYSSLNTTFSCDDQTPGTTSGYEPFNDGVGYNFERMVCTKAGAFTGLPAYDPRIHGYGAAAVFTRDMRWNEPEITPASPKSVTTHDPYRLDIVGDRVNEDTFMVVLQGADSVDPIMPVTTLTVGTSNAVAASFTPAGGSLTEVIIPKTLTPTFPISVTRTGSAATQYWQGLTPGTTYKLSDSGGVTTLNTSGAGTSVVADTAGLVIAAVDESISSPTITLVATPASLAASCVNGGSNPADQTVALTVTGDGGEAAISFSDDSAAISETLSGGSAPQNTPQTMTVAFGGCSGLSVGTHNLTISVTSGTTYVVNSPLTIPVTVTVTANPLIAASPASVNFTATVSGANPANQTVNISRTVSGDLGSITDDADWLTVTPSSATGITSQDLTLAVDIAGLDPGQHTATITVASSGASNTPITITVLLALDNPPVIGLEPRPGTTMIQFRYLAPSRAACTVRACTSPACSSVVASSSDGGGHPIRIYTLTGLTAATTYTVQTNCAGDIKARQVTTRAATGGPTITLPIDVFNAVGADNIVVDYGADDTLSETAVNGSCSGTRCTATITWSNANRLLWFQVTFRDSENNVLRTEAVKAKSLIPE